MKFLACMIALLTLGVLIRDHAHLTFHIGESLIALAVAAVIADLTCGSFILGAGSPKNRQRQRSRSSS